jgi:hypothetical protein
MILTLRLLAVLGLGVLALGIVEIIVIYGLSLWVGSGFSLLLGVMLLATSYLAQLLCLALSILALIATVRTRRWRWCALVVLLSVMSVILPSLLYFFPSSSPILASLEATIGLEAATLVALFLLPALLPVGTLTYTVRST